MAKRRYSRNSQSVVKEAMHKYKRGKLKAGRSGKRVKSRRQAVAIGLSEARRKGYIVPKPRSSQRKRRGRRGIKK